jgi:hypothetical protein
MQSHGGLRVLLRTVRERECRLHRLWRAMGGGASHQSEGCQGHAPSHYDVASRRVVDAVGQTLIECRDNGHACRVGGGGLALCFPQLGPPPVLLRVGDREHAIELDCDAEEVASGGMERLSPRG